MAIAFSGGNYLYTQENPGVLDGLTQYTAMCWARPRRLSGFQACFSRQVGTGSGETIWLGFNGTAYNVFISLTTTGFAITSGVATLGAWVHLACAYTQPTNGRAILYVNGVLQAQGSGTGTLPATTRGLFVGGNSNGAGLGSLGDFIQGDVDDIRIYNRALGPTVIGTIATGKGKDGIYAGLLCRYSMFGPDGVNPASVPNITSNPTLNLVTQSGTPTFTPGITEARGRPTPRLAVRG